MKKRYLLLSALSVALLAGCNSTAKAPEAEQTNATKSALPEWVMNPILEDGIAASDCVPWTGDMSLDRAEAVAKARADLAKQIETKVQAMDKTYARKVKTADGTSTGGTFESVSKQVTAQNLSRTQVLKVDVVDIKEIDHLCAMVGFGSTATKALFDQLVDQSEAKDTLRPEDESALYEEFKSTQAQKELEASTQGM